MSYNGFLDAYFSSLWTLYLLPLVLFVIAILIVNMKSRRLFGRYVLKFIIIAIPILLIFLSALINPIYLGYGHPAEIKEIEFIKGNLYVLDYIKTAGSKTSSGEACYRVHIIDPITGKKKLRFRIGNKSEILGVKGDTIVFSHYNDFAFYSISTGKELAVWSKETLPKIFSELSSGIDHIMWSGGKEPKLEFYQDNTSTSKSSTYSLSDRMMEITALDGKNWMLKPMETPSLVLSNKKNFLENYIPTKKLYVKEHDILIDNEIGGSYFVQLESDNGNQYQRVLSRKDSVINKDLSFVGGKFVAVCEKDNCYIIEHFETTKKQRFILTCMSMDGKTKLWEIKQSEFDKTKIDPESNFEVSSTFSIDKEKGLIYFSIKREVFCAKLKDGSILWRTSL
ncbi:MAG: hypothetical protein HXX09_16425 [Bacteroidetes bacterium]|nr:hypothetical protein [Bacteroidota bacterium]